MLLDGGWFFEIVGVYIFEKVFVKIYDVKCFVDFFLSRNEIIFFVV